MRLHLIYHRPDPCKSTKIYQTVGIEIGNANRANTAGFVQLLQRPPCAVIIGKRLMQQTEIQIVGAQLAHGFPDGFFRFLITAMLHPDFGGQKNIPAVNAGLFNRRAAGCSGVYRLETGIL